MSTHNGINGISHAVLAFPLVVVKPCIKFNRTLVSLLGIVEYLQFDPITGAQRKRLFALSPLAVAGNQVSSR